MSIPLLVQATRDDNPRLREFVVLYAVSKTADAKKLGFLQDEFLQIRDIIGDSQIENLPPSKLDELSHAYRKRIASWEHRKNQFQHIQESKRSRLRANLALKEKTGLPVATIARELSLNKGNLNAYFKNANISKLSLDSATSVMRYLKKAAQE